MRKVWIGLTLSAIAGSLINVAIACACLYWQAAPMDPWPPPPAQWYWDRYIGRSPQYGNARYDAIVGAPGCDFLIIDASSPNIGSGAPPRMMITRAGFPLRSFEGMH